MTDPEQVPVLDAATVVLLRDGREGLESWLLTRVAGMVFAPNMTVFPGGRVEDQDAELPWSGRPPEEIAAQFGHSTGRARSLVGAAVREVFEETGVLLTSPAANLAIDPSTVESGRVAFGELLVEHGLAIDGDSVLPWARWVTPVGEPRRYDTHFFVAPLPPDAQPADLTTETTSAQWISVATALAERRERRRSMLPPTRVVLGELAELGSAARVCEAAVGRVIEAVRVVRRIVDGRVVVDLPDGTTMPR